MNLDALVDGVKKGDPLAIARAITLVENDGDQVEKLFTLLEGNPLEDGAVIGITGPPGVGKSTLVSGLAGEFRKKSHRVGIIAVDPSSTISGGAFLGDRVRMMEHARDREVILRSMAARGRLGGLCAAAGGAARIMASGGCTVILVETVGVGQSEVDIAAAADMTVLVLAPGLGDDIQALKAGILEMTDMVVINKADSPGSDKLSHDLSDLFQQKDTQRRIHGPFRTVATQGIGVPDLAWEIASLAAAFREDGTRAIRRRQAHEQEILSYVLDVVSPLILSRIREKGLENRDPRVCARNLASEMRRRMQTPPWIGETKTEAP